MGSNTQPADVLAAMDLLAAGVRTLREFAQDTGSFRVSEQGATNLAAACEAAIKVIEARAAVEELIERERKLLAYIAAIKVQATEAPVCDTDRLRLVVMYCDDAIASAGGAK